MAPCGFRIRCALAEDSSAWLIKSMRLPSMACIWRATTLATPDPSARVARMTAIGRNTGASLTWKTKSVVARTAARENATDSTPSARIQVATLPATASSGAPTAANDVAPRAPRLARPSMGRSITMGVYHTADGAWRPARSRMRVASNPLFPARPLADHRRIRVKKGLTTTTREKSAASRGPSSSRPLFVAVRALHALVALLRLDRQGGDRPRLEPADADRLGGLLAEAVAAGLDPHQRLVDLGDELALAVARAELQRAIGLERGAVGDVGLGQADLFHVLQRARGFGEQLGAPAQQLLAEIFELDGAHEVFFIRRAVIGRKRRPHQHLVSPQNGASI